MNTPCIDECDHYRCKLLSIHMTTGSVGGVLQGAPGRKAFHGDHPDGGTIGERRARMITEARAKGVRPTEMTRREAESYDAGRPI